LAEWAEAWAEWEAELIPVSLSSFSHRDQLLIVPGVLFNMMNGGGGGSFNFGGGGGGGFQPGGGRRNRGSAQGGFPPGFSF